MFNFVQIVKLKNFFFLLDSLYTKIFFYNSNVAGFPVVAKIIWVEEDNL